MSSRKARMRWLLEGPDGAGKTTLAAALAQAVRDAGKPYSVLLVSDPNHAVGACNAAGAVSVRDILLAPHACADLTRNADPQTPRTRLDGPWPPEVAASLFCAGEAYTAICVRAFEERTLAERRTPITIFDRWSPSTIVYQAMPKTAATKAWHPHLTDRVVAITQQYRRMVRLAMTSTILLLPDAKHKDDDRLYRRIARRAGDAYESTNEVKARTEAAERLSHYRWLPALLRRQAATYAAAMGLLKPIVVDAAQSPADVLAAVIARLPKAPFS